MADRISELETEKHYLEASYEKICFESSTHDITVETLTERFNAAKTMPKSGELESAFIKSLSSMPHVSIVKVYF